jgi:hypothetical protein
MKPEASAFASSAAFYLQLSSDHRFRSGSSGLAAHSRGSAAFARPADHGRYGAAFRRLGALATDIVQSLGDPASNVR